MKAIVDGLAIEYKDEGTGPTLVLLHGWKDSLHTFDKIVPMLTDDFRVVRLDLPGFGQSETPKKAWTVEDYAKCVAACIKKIEITPFAFIGHSLGGRIVLKGMGEDILHAERAVLIASAGVARRKTARNHFFYIVAKIGKVFMSVPPLSFFKDGLRKKMYAAAGSDYLDAGDLKQTFLNVIEEDLSRMAEKVSAPTLLVWGENDTETVAADGKRLAKLMPDATLRVISRTGHYVHHAHAEDVAQLIRAHLTTHTYET